MDRVVFAVALLAAPGVVLLLMLQGLWRLADTESAEDPSQGGESPTFKLNRRVFTNTLEQLAIFAPLFLVLSARIDADLV